MRSRPGQDLILDAERFKASVEKPKGKSRQINCNFDLDKLKRLITQSEDDEFFHRTCHVDETLKAKIEKGAFVDLQKLLPKNRFQMLNEEQKMQFVNKNDVPYWWLQIMISCVLQVSGNGSKPSDLCSYLL